MTANQVAATKISEGYFPGTVADSAEPEAGSELNCIDYRIWTKLMEMSLTKEDKLVYVSGTLVQDV